jgi:hypothetical protein
MGNVRTIPALPPQHIRVGYSGTPEREEKKRLQKEWGKVVEKVIYRGNEFWIPGKTPAPGTRKTKTKSKPNLRPSTKV